MKKIDYDAFGGRRFLMCVACQVVNAWLLYAGKLTPEPYQWIVLGTVAAYITGNVAQRIKAPDAPAAPQPQKG
jgi:hypothetical protein